MRLNIKVNTKYMTNVKYYAFWIVIILVIIFWLRSLGPTGPEVLIPGQTDLGDDLFTEEVPVEELDRLYDPLF